MNSVGLEEMIERLRKQLYDRVNDLEQLTHPRVVELSQRLDKLVFKVQRVKYGARTIRCSYKFVSQNWVLRRCFNTWTPHSRISIRKKSATGGFSDP